MLKVIYENDYCGEGYAALVPDSAEWTLDGDTCERLEDMTNLFESVLRTLSFTESQIDSVLNRNYSHSCPYDFEDDEDCIAKEEAYNKLLEQQLQKAIKRSRAIDKMTMAMPEAIDRFVSEQFKEEPND